MAIKIMQLSNPNFLSQLGAEYVCTAFMFHSMPASEELKQSKEGYIPGVDIGSVPPPGASTAFPVDVYGTPMPWAYGEDPSGQLLCPPGWYSWDGKCWPA